MSAARVVVVSDSHLSARTPEATAHWDALVDHVAAAAPDLVVHAGDISTDGELAPDDLAYARAQLDRLARRSAVLPGNHDVGDGADWATRARPGRRPTARPVPRRVRSPTGSRSGSALAPARRRRPAARLGRARGGRAVGLARRRDRPRCPRDVPVGARPPQAAGARPRRPRPPGPLRARRRRVRRLLDLLARPRHAPGRVGARPPGASPRPRTGAPTCGRRRPGRCCPTASSHRSAPSGWARPGWRCTTTAGSTSPTSGCRASTTSSSVTTCRRRTARSRPSTDRPSRQCPRPAHTWAFGGR